MYVLNINDNKQKFSKAWSIFTKQQNATYSIKKKYNNNEKLLFKRSTQGQ